MDHILPLVRQVTLYGERIASQKIKDYDISYAQFKILMLLYKYPNRLIKQIDIEQYFGMTNPTVTGLLNNLEKAGWIKRTTHPDDGRCKVVVLQTQALQMQGTFCKIADDIEVDFTKQLSNEENERLRQLLNKIVKGR